MLSQPSFYDGARPNPETERRAPEMGQSRQARLGQEKKSSGSIMAPIAADSQVCCSLWSVLLLVSTFWPKPDVPCAEQQVPLQRPETNHKTNLNELQEKAGDLPRQELHGEAV